jgi:hypothetical protein
MSAPKENQYWKLRCKHGRCKIFKSPESLWKYSCEYLEWVDSDFWFKIEVVKSGDRAGEILRVPAKTPYTLTGLFLYLDIDENTWQRYRNEETYTDFWAIVNRIDNIIYC